MIEYNKIGNIYKRDDNTKKIIVGAYKDEYIEFLRNLEWEFTEKVDGTNVRVHWDGHKIEFAGRTNKPNNLPTHLVDKLEELFGGIVNEEIFEQHFNDKDVILFGEGYGDKIQTNGYTEKGEVNFILFDVIVDGVYLSRADVEEIAKYFNINCVPVLLSGTLDDGVEYVLNNRRSIVSKVGGEIEGLVGRPKFELKDRRGNRIIVKIKYNSLFNSN